MALEVNGTTIDTNDNGYLGNAEDWSDAVADAIAAQEEVTLTDRHRDVIAFLRQEFLDNHGSQPNTRTIVKAMSDAWGEKVKQGDLYALFPGDPSKQGGKIAGLPESRRKGGY